MTLACRSFGKKAALPERFPVGCCACWLKAALAPRPANDLGSEQSDAVFVAAAVIDRPAPVRLDAANITDAVLVTFNEPLALVEFIYGHPYAANELYRQCCRTVKELIEQLERRGVEVDSGLQAECHRELLAACADHIERLKREQAESDDYVEGNIE